MIFLDTSVWVDFFIGKTPSLIAEVYRLLDEDVVALPSPVRIELLSGASKQDAPRLRRVLSALATYYPQESTWQLIEEWIGNAKIHGHRFGFGDLLIAAIASDRKAKIWSLDADFLRMAKLKWAELHFPQ